MFTIGVISSVFRAIGRVIARFVELIRITVAPRGGAPTDCDDAGHAPGCGANPRVCGSSQAVVYGPMGALAEYPTPCGTGPHTLVRGQAGLVGLDAAARAELRFAPAAVVTIQVVHFSNPGKIEAFHGGSLVDTKVMASTAGLAQQFTLNGNGIDRIVVTPASANDVTLVIGWCH